MYKVILAFHDAKSFRLYRPGEVIDWPDSSRVKAALERGLIEEIKPAKAAPKEEPKPKAPVKKKTTKSRG